MPVARTAATDLLLPGVGVTGDAPGTDPMWFDPARWNNTIHPHFSAHDQFATIVAMSVALAGSVSVLAYIIFMIVVAPPGSRRRAWREGWVVFVPQSGGDGRYLMVILTARYVMAFILAGIAVLATCAYRAPGASDERAAALLTLARIQPASPTTAFGFSFVVAIAGTMLVGTLVPTRRHVLFMVLIPLTFVFCAAVMSPAVPALMRIGGAAFVLLLQGNRCRYPAAAERCDSPGRDEHGARPSSGSGARSVAGAAHQSRRHQRRRRRPDESRSGASHRTRRGMESSRHAIALIGPHAESYWARMARLKIVANVPDPIAPIWWLIPRTARDTLLRKFAERGATVAILTRQPPTGPPDSSWVPLRYQVGEETQMTSS